MWVPLGVTWFRNGPWPSLMVVVLIVFCLRLPETRASWAKPVRGGPG